MRGCTTAAIRPNGGLFGPDHAEAAGTLDCHEPAGAFGARGHQTSLGQAAGSSVERLLQHRCMTDARTAPETGSTLQFNAWLPGTSPKIWRYAVAGPTEPRTDAGPARFLRGHLLARGCGTGGLHLERNRGERNSQTHGGAVQSQGTSCKSVSFRNPVPQSHPQGRQSRIPGRKGLPGSWQCHCRARSGLPGSCQDPRSCRSAHR